MIMSILTDLTGSFPLDIYPTVMALATSDYLSYESFSPLQATASTVVVDNNINCYNTTRTRTWASVTHMPLLSNVVPLLHQHNKQSVADDDKASA